ncbi:MAG TPA: penicillin-binding transpeptidase domain-containing protein [Aldersonia sp.]
MRAAVVGVTAFAAVAAAGCTPRPEGPVPNAQVFVDAFAVQDLGDAATATDRPNEARRAMAAAWEGLQGESMTATIGDAKINGDTARVSYTYEWHLPKDRVWTYTGELQMGRRDGVWGVRWTSSDIHPQLGDTQTMALRSTAAPRARVNERSGSDVLVPGVVQRISFDPRKAADPVGEARRLADALDKFDPTIKAQSIVESSTAANGAYHVATLQQDHYEQVQALLSVLPGVVVGDEADLVTTDRDFAPDVISQIKKTVIDEVDGKAGWSVVTVNSNGADTDVLTETSPQPVPSFSVTLDRPIQDAAQRAVDARAEQTMMVVIQPSTGAILAVAQNAAADRDGPVATTGLYPPGSTFKIITAGAAIQSGLATPHTSVPCPGRIEIGERSIPNYDGFSLGTVPMATAFARSCNTSFAKLASELAPDGLHLAAAELGIGQDYSVVGVPTESGSVPPADDLVQRTEDGFGQGKVLVSPFGMALAAATVAHGSAPVPNLLAGHETTIEGERPPITPEMVDGLRSMMRLVVTSGTATRISGEGEIHGKTGEAEVDGGSHAWFVGYRGDLAFATLVVKGGSSDNAVAVTKDMFDMLPVEY